MTPTDTTPDKNRPGTVRQAIAQTAKVSLTLGVMALAGLAVVGGNQELTRRAEAAPAPTPAPAIPVATRPISLVSGYTVSRSFIGQVEAQRAAAISFELSGRLDDILVDEGDIVAKGQRIANLDLRLLEAERTRLMASQSALLAQLRFSDQTVERQTRLSEDGFASQAALDEATSRSDELRARIAEVEAALFTNQLQIEKSSVVAPFAGRIADRHVDGGESVSPGQPLVTIVESGVPRVRVGLPLALSEEALSDVEIEIAGEALVGKLLTLRPDIDPVTRTRTALFEVVTDTPLAFGQTAQLKLSDEVTAKGLWVSVTALKEGLRGQWTLLSVDDADIVRAISVQVLHAEDDRVFVSGAFPGGTRLVADGPQRITVGQRVDTLSDS